ncbi:beta-glucosidase [Fusarium sp. MPI-SDFR-AT-0072]|nr:beta-glucosidase [Fusarium sp. MPI-SDFR-AT-0072]
MKAHGLGLGLITWTVTFTSVFCIDEHFQPIEVLPTNHMAGYGPRQEAYLKARNFVNQLTLAEKASIVTGTSGPCGGNIGPIPRLNFRGICFQDSPVGVRETDFTTVFPAGLSAAASFDKKLILERANMMGSEFRGKGIQVAMGPVAGAMGRHALGGRNWEGFSIDPYLAGVAMELSITGLQNHGVASVGKHYIGNEQETQRFPSKEGGREILALSSNIDDRTMHELYLWPFAQAVKAGVSWIMCGYNRLNQTYTCENSKALNGLLKEELRFDGAIISDWGATKSGLSSIQAGLDVTMPGGARSPFGANIVALVKNGSLPEERLDDMIHRIMTPYFFFRQDEDFPPLDPSINELKSSPVSEEELEGYLIGGEKSRDVRGDHSKLVRELGAASAVLVKNEGALPLIKPKNIAVFGNDAADLSEGQFEATFLKDSVGPNFGTMAQGGGSGSARYTYFVSPLEAIKKRGEAHGALVQYILSNQQAADSIHTIYPLPEVCLVFLKTYAAEGFDRISLDVDWNGTAVVNTVAARCPNTVVITHSPGINLMPWADHPNVTAIIAAHLPGQEAGHSIVDVLYGDYNPTGKLPYTIAFEESDYNAPLINLTTPVTNSNAWQSDFTEGLFVDYRHFDAANITPRYEFGHGLSYTTFGIHEASIANQTHGLSAYPEVESALSPGGNAHLYDTILAIDARVVNTGDVAGATVVQLYVSFPGSAPEGTPVKVLRGFEKTTVLASGVSETVTFDLHRRDVSFWDVDAQDWKIPPGLFEFQVGLSSRDIKQTIKTKLRCE